MKYTHLGLLGILSCPNISYGGYIQDVQLVVLIDPIEEEALGIDAHRHRRPSARVLKKKNIKNLGENGSNTENQRQKQAP